MIVLVNSILQIQHCIDLLQEFLTETPYKYADQVAQDREHLGKLCYGVMKQGFIWIAYDNDKPVGMLMSVIEPSMWNPQIRQYRELVWFVKKEVRKSLVGGRLFKKFIDKADELLASQQIHQCFTTRMSTTDSIGLERRGFCLAEHVYLKERD